MCFRTLVVCLALAAGGCGSSGPPQRARNVILFLADGTGPSTVNMASLQAHGKPQALYVQRMPALGLSETSASDDWVTDSAAGMTAIVTGEKTDRGVLSLVSPKFGGARASQPLKTILEYAEERGLSTGLISNSPMTDATPAANYSHTASRRNTPDVAEHFVKPRFGDGVDVFIGPGRQEMIDGAKERGIDLQAAWRDRGYTVLDSPAALAALRPLPDRLVALWEGTEYDMQMAADKALEILSRNPKGFYLMFERNNHGVDMAANVEGMARMDRIVESVAERYKQNSLVIFTADHSFDMRLVAGGMTRDIYGQVRLDDEHTGEEVIAAGAGPGSEKIRGFFPNTFLFEVMMQAYGWQPASR